MNTTFHVTGMTCGGCEQSVARIIRALPEVADVSVDRGQQRAQVQWKENTDAQAAARASRAICTSVSAAGFECSVA